MATGSVRSLLAALFAALVTIAILMVPTSARSSTPGGNPNAGCNQQDETTGGVYDATCDGTQGGNGNNDNPDHTPGPPCAGCVGHADNQEPPGQQPGGSDANNGYECDGNQGIGQGNPAHTSCTPSPTPTSVEPTPTPTPTETSVEPTPTPTPTPTETDEDVCPNIEGMQTTVPPGMTVAASGECTSPRDNTPPNAPPVGNTPPTDAPPETTPPVDAPPVDTPPVDTPDVAPDLSTPGDVVLGVRFTRPRLGFEPSVAADRVEAAVQTQQGALPFTGTAVTWLVPIALMLIAPGALLAFGRRARKN
jgi:hypothetical protein